MTNMRRIIVIGGGVGGYPAAIRAARLGAEVTLVEKAEMGGTCLNRGCIPTKSFLQSVEVARTVREAELFGVKTTAPTIDFPGVARRKDQVVKKLRQGVESLVKAKKIKLVRGTAKVLNPRKVAVDGQADLLEADALILATGSVPGTVPIPGLAEAHPWTSDEFLEMEEPPKNVAIIGGGVIGVEVAQCLAGFGSSVTVLEMMPGLVPGLDSEISKTLQRELKKQKITVELNAMVEQVSSKKGSHTLTYSVSGKSKTLEVEQIVVAVGRKPVLLGVDGPELGLKIEKGAVVVNDRMETSIKGVYAVGDMTGGIMLAHVASAEAECAAMNAMGVKRNMSYRAVPSCVYTSPEIASVGLSEEQAREQGEIEVGRFPFSACGKALVIGQTAGMVKIIADTKYKEVLGIHIIGPHATDLIAEGVLGMSLETTVEEIAHAIHPHPTLSETLMEAALSLSGGAVHIP